MPSCSMYVVGVALILVAVGYQYRNDITHLLARDSSSGRSQQPHTTSVQPKETTTSVHDKQPKTTLQPLPAKPVEFTEEELKVSNICLVPPHPHRKPRPLTCPTHTGSQ